MAFTGDTYTVEGGSLKLGTTELNAGGTVKVDYAFAADAADLPTYGSFPYGVSVGGKKTITGTIEYWAGDSATAHITGDNVGDEMAMVHLIPSHFKFSGNIIITNIAESYDAGSSEPVKSIISWKLSGAPTIAIGASAV